MAPLARICVAFLACLPLAWALSVIETTYSPPSRRAEGTAPGGSVSFALGSKQYYVPLFTGYELYVSSGPFGDFPAYAPVTVVDVTGAATCTAIEAIINEYLAKDDVFDVTFAAGERFSKRTKILSSNETGRYISAVRDEYLGVGVQLLAVQVRHSGHPFRRCVPGAAEEHSECSHIERGYGQSSGSRLYL